MWHWSSLAFPASHAPTTIDTSPPPAVFLSSARRAACSLSTLGGSRPLVVFAAIDWSRESHGIEEDNAEYTLWIFPDRSLAAADSTGQAPILPLPLRRSLGLFSSELNGGSVPPLVTHAFVVDPAGKPHEIPASHTGVTRFHDSQPVVPAA